VVKSGTWTLSDRCWFSGALLESPRGGTVIDASPSLVDGVRRHLAMCEETTSLAKKG
jgi:hypothetical protein